MRVTKIKYVDNALERALKDQMIKRGIYVNDMQLLSDNATDEEIEAAFDALTYKKIDVYGVGAPYDRGAIERNRIVIDRTSVPAGDFRFQYKYYFEPIDYDGEGNPTAYKKYKVSSGLSELEYTVRYVAYDRDVDRDFMETIINAFGAKRKFMHELDNGLSKIGDGFYVHLTGDPVTLSLGTYIERFFRYRAKELLLEEFEYIGDVPRVDEISFEVGMSADKNDEPLAESENI